MPLISASDPNRTKSGDSAMKHLLYGLSLVLALTAVGSAQPPVRKKVAAPAPVPAAVNSRISMGEVTPTPEMWFYEQMLRRYENPQAAVRANAEADAAARKARIATRQWYGMSNARPTANVSPYISTYSPTWVGNGAAPAHWVPATPLMVRTPATTTVVK